MAKPKQKQNDNTQKEELKSLEFEFVDIDSIFPNEYNPNRQSDHEFELLCRSIEEDGFTQPILVHKPSMQIIDGEHRWRALKALGETRAPVYFSDMEIADMKISTLRHNRARGSEDIQRAADVFRELQLMGAQDWAADSLLMDQVDLTMMTNLVSSAQLHLREQNMDFDQIQETLLEERKRELQMQVEQREMQEKDHNKYTIQMTFLADEASLVRRVLGSNVAEGVLRMCKYWEQVAGAAVAGAAIANDG